MVMLTDILMTLESDETVEFRNNRSQRYVEFRVSKGRSDNRIDLTVNTLFSAIIGYTDFDPLAVQVELALREIRERYKSRTKSKAAMFAVDPYYDDFIHGHYDDGRGTA